MSPARPLPTAIGPTENALRSLLQRALLDSPIEGYVEWVAMNYLAGEPVPAAQVTDKLADVLKTNTDTVHAALEQLQRRGLVVNHDTPVLTPNGLEALQHARQQVQSSTAQVVEGLSDHDLNITIRVLDHVRANAERVLR